VSDALVELDYGEWTGRSFHDLESDPDWRRFNMHRSLGRVPGGETMLEVQVRAMNELERLRRLHEGETVAVVSHAEWIRSVVLHFLGAPLDLFARIDISTASVSTIDLSEWAPVVRGLNAV